MDRFTTLCGRTLGKEMAHLALIRKEWLEGYRHGLALCMKAKNIVRL